MATVRIWREEFDRLPNYCVVCGEETARKQPVKLTWITRWYWVLFASQIVPWTCLIYGGLFIVLILLLVVHAVMQQVRTLRLPVCERHRRHWLWTQKLPVWFAFGSFVSAIVVGAFAEKFQFYALETLGLGGITVLVMLGIAVGSHRGSVRATHIMEDSVTLTGVRKIFAEAVRRNRRDTAREEDDLDPRLISPSAPQPPPPRWSRRRPPP